jgi:hypothetical protein
LTQQLARHILWDMTTARTVFLALICCVACSGEQSREDATQSASSGALRAVAIPNERLISESGIGPVRLGVSLDSARSMHPGLVFSRTSDGEGVALVQVVSGPDTLIAYLGEEDPSAPVNSSKVVRSVETFSPNFLTEQGIHAGSLVTDAENAYGKTKEISRSEIESREFITFADQPAKLDFRLDSGAGVFEPDSTMTTRTVPGARIFSISVRE